MRILWVAVAVATAATAVGVLVSLDGPDAPPEDPDDPTWHAAASSTATERFCGDCHYGLMEMWDATWTQADRNWSLEVAPAYIEVPLYGVQVAGDESDLVLAGGAFETFEWTVGDTWSTEFEVPPEATVVFARVHFSGSDDENAALVMGGATYRVDDGVTALALVAPDGTRHEADGPQEDLRMLTVPAAAGTWRLEATLSSADAPQGVGTVLWEALGGQVVDLVDSRADPLRLELAGNETGAPPELYLRLRPHHDHAAYENADWDPYDASPFVTHFTPALGPAPVPRVWNQTDIDGLWGDATERVVLERAGTFAGAYVDEEGHNDPGAGSSYPAFGPMGDPVWPGTTTVRFEVTWEPAVEVPGMNVRFSPASTPYFFVANAVERGAGRAVFETAVQPQWWEHPEQVLAWFNDSEVTSYWDIAPYVEGDGPQAHAVDWDLRVVASR